MSLLGLSLKKNTDENDAEEDPLLGTVTENIEGEKGIYSIPPVCMICQSIPFPKAFWEWLSDSHSQKAYGNAVVISSSVFA